MGAKYGEWEILMSWKDLVEILQVYFQFKTSTPSYIIHGELGATPLYIDIQTRILSFWCNLIQNSAKH